MTDIGIFLLTGLGLGALYASLAMGIVIIYKGTGVINFAAGAMGGWSAYVYSDLTTTGHLALPVIGIPGSVTLTDGPLGVVPAVLMSGAYGAVLGLLVHLLVFRPLRGAPVLAKVVASAGLMLFIQALTLERFGQQPRVINPILTGSSITLAGIGVPKQIFWLSGIVVAVSVAVAIWFRVTRTGLAVRAAADNELVASLARFSPDKLSGVAWTAASTIIGFLTVLAAPLTGLTASSSTLYVIPALACALMGRLWSVGPAVTAGFGLGMIDSEITYLASKSWWPTWANTGVTSAIPFLVIVIVLYFLGNSLPTRDTLRSARLPSVPRPKLRPFMIVGSGAIGVLLLIITHGTYRFGLITSMGMVVVALSIVVLTGLLGQVSLAQAAFAGIGGFALSEFSVHLGIGFPWAPLLSALVAAVVGVIAGLPALRIRGTQLAVVTIAMALAFEKVVFSNQSLNGISGNPVPQPRLPGINLAVRSGDDIARLPFALMCLVIVMATGIGVVNLTRSGTGRRFLAVRSNERAAASVGVSVTGTKLFGFAMSAFLAGLGGTLTAYAHGSVSVESFTTIVGVSWLIYAYLGGITSLGGSLQAGLLVNLGIAYVVINSFVGTTSSAYLLVSALLLIVTVIFSPEGIAGATRRGVAPLLAGLPPAKWTRLAIPKAEARPDDDNAREKGPKSVGAAPVAASPKRDGNPRLQLEALSVNYGGVRALHEVSLKVRGGSIVGLIGANGAGKTTLIDAVSGFISYQGSVSLAGAGVDDQSPHRRARQGLARTWQSAELFGDLSVLENVQVACEPASIVRSLLDCVRPDRHESTSVPRACLAAVGLDPHAHQFPSQLTLGQEKLLSVARALANNPKIILMDEPAAGLSTAETTELGRLLRQLVHERDLSILLVEHDVALVTEICDYMYVLNFGRLIAEGVPAEVRSNPAVIDAYLGAGQIPMGPEVPLERGYGPVPSLETGAPRGG